MKRHMLIDPDHLDVLARKGLLDLTESKDYPGVVSSHSWSSKDAYPRIYNDKGFVAPYAGASSTFVQAWKEMNAISNSSVYQGIGWGADQNGFGAQGPPRADAAAKGNQVKYPFKSFDGGVTLDRQRTGNRVFDINKDGVAHYGLYPDWVEDLKQQAGPKIQEDLARGAEAYLQTWERAEGVPSTACRSGRGKFTKNGLFNVFLGDTPKPLLFRAGQPGTRVNRTWTWCVDGKRNGGTKVRAVFNPQGAVALVATDARGYRASRIERGARVARLKKKVKGLKKFGKGVLVKKLKGKKKLIFGVKKKRVAFIGVAGRSTGRKPKALKSYLKLAGF
jgi:hypothetical protein